jgi:hypothetical protein
MATRRRSRRKSISGNLTDIQKRIRYLETRPGAGRLASKAVATKNLALRAVEEDTVADNAIVRRSIANAAVGTAEIEQDSITNALLATNAVNADSIEPGAVGTTELAPDAVTTDKIATNAVTTNEMAPDSVTNSQIATNAVNADSVAPGAIGTNELADLAVTTAKIDNAAVTTAKIGDLQVTDAKIDGIQGSKIIGGVDGDLIINGSIEAIKIAGVNATVLIGDIESNQIADGAITTAKIGSKQVTADRIADNTITANQLGQDSVGYFQMQNNAVRNEQVDATGIAASKITSGTFSLDRIPVLNSTKLGNGAATNSVIGAGSITIGKIAQGATIFTSIVSGTGINITNSGVTNGYNSTISANIGTGSLNVAAGNHTHSGGTTVASHTHPLPGTSYAIGPSGSHNHGGTTSNTTHSHGLTLTGNTLSNTSTLRAKKEIQDHTFDPKKLLTLKLKKYKYKNEFRSLQDNLNREWMYGYIAEEVQEAGIEEILGYDSEGQVASLQYGTLVTLAIELIKEQQNDIDFLKEEIQRLKEKI